MGGGNIVKSSEMIGNVAIVGGVVKVRRIDTDTDKEDTITLQKGDSIFPIWIKNLKKKNKYIKNLKNIVFKSLN